MQSVHIPEERLSILKKLIETPSPSGFEQQIQSYIRMEIENYVDNVKKDVLGNLIGSRNEQGKPRIMLMAHCDEIGLMISHISNEGYLYFLPIGLVDDHLLPGERVVIHSRNGPIWGVIGRKPVLIQTTEEKRNVLPLKQQWIDIGAESKEDAETMISIGDPVTFTTDFQKIGNKDVITARALDDKLGIFVLIETLRKLSDRGEHEAAVFGVFTVQEEIGLRGATPVAYQINAHAAFILDIGFPSDSPDTIPEKQDLGDIRIGKGPILDKGGNNNPVLYQLLLDIAKAKSIPLQFRATPMPIANEAKVVQLSRSGVATISVNIPARYSHSPNEVASLRDLEYTSELLTQTIFGLTPQINFAP
ncbi:MAG: M42 family metallopeptidase [Candidatus Hodarchaeota archaeon]